METIDSYYGRIRNHYFKDNCHLLHHKTDNRVLVYWDLSKLKNRRRIVGELTDALTSFSGGFDLHILLPKSTTDAEALIKDATEFRHNHNSVPLHYEICPLEQTRNIGWLRG